MTRLTFTPDTGLSGDYTSPYDARAMVRQLARELGLVISGHPYGYLLDNQGNPIHHFRMSEV